MKRTNFYAEISKRTGVKTSEVSKVVRGLEELVCDLIEQEDFIKLKFGEIGGRFQAPRKTKSSYSQQYCGNYGNAKHGRPYVTWSDYAYKGKQIPPHEYFEEYGYPDDFEGLGDCYWTIRAVPYEERNTSIFSNWSVLQEIFYQQALSRTQLKDTMAEKGISFPVNGEAPKKRKSKEELIAKHIEQSEEIITKLEALLEEDRKKREMRTKETPDQIFEKEKWDDYNNYNNYDDYEMAAQSKK